MRRVKSDLWKKAIATVNKLKIGLFCQRSAANIE